MISIYEPPIRNSGIIGGKFLEGTRIPKPDCDREKPVFYGPADLSIGATICVLRHRFIIQVNFLSVKFNLGVGFEINNSNSETSVATKYKLRNSETGLPILIGWIPWAHKWSPLIDWEKENITG